MNLPLLKSPIVKSDSDRPTVNFKQLVLESAMSKVSLTSTTGLVRFEKRTL